jgi:hypothetical protein
LRGSLCVGQFLVAIRFEQLPHKPFDVLPCTFEVIDRRIQCALEWA